MTSVNTVTTSVLTTVSPRPNTVPVTRGVANTNLSPVTEYNSSPSYIICTDCRAYLLINLVHKCLCQADRQHQRRALMLLFTSREASGPGRPGGRWGQHLSHTGSASGPCQKCAKTGRHRVWWSGERSGLEADTYGSAQETAMALTG